MGEPVRLFDTHCHLDDKQFDADRDSLITGLPAQGIHQVLSCGSDLISSRACLNLALQYPHVYAAAGIHPHEAAKAGEGDLSQIAQLLKEDKVVALGEIGLDFYYDFSPRQTQTELLQQQLDLAYQMNKPVVLHVREAQGAMLELLQARAGRLPGGVLHCFSGSAESAVAYQKLGFYISFAGSLTFKNAVNLQKAAQAVALNRLLIETDSPYLAPVPFRGRRNDPAKVAEVARFLSGLLGLSFEEVARITRENACRLFRIPAVPQA